MDDSKLLGDAYPQIPILAGAKVFAKCATRGKALLLDYRSGRGNVIRIHQRFVRFSGDVWTTNSALESKLLINDVEI